MTSGGTIISESDRKRDVVAGIHWIEHLVIAILVKEIGELRRVSDLVGKFNNIHYLFPHGISHLNCEIIHFQSTFSEFRLADVVDAVLA